MLGWVGYRNGDRDCEPAQLTEHQATVGLGRVNVPTSLQYPLERHRDLERRWQRLLDELARTNTMPPRDPDDDSDEEEEDQEDEGRIARTRGAYAASRFRRMRREQDN